MNKIRTLTTLCTGILLWMTACTKDYHANNSLSRATYAVDTNPQEALKLLEGISPEHLYDSDTDQYMQFVVILTQARYMDYQDITGDSLILDAQRYFACSRNYEMAARASYYAAIYWHEGETGDKAVDYWQAAFHFAEKAGNKLFIAKSAYSLGMSYYNQERWEDALPYCRKALEYYENKSNVELYKLDIIELLGHIYLKKQDFERAFNYFDDGLKAARKQNNTKYESRFYRDKGIIHRNKEEYRRAKECFELALSIQPVPDDDKLRIYLSYARLYRETNRPDSTHYYLSLIEDRIPEITYPITRRNMYSELATYYKSTKGDGDKIALYSQLAHEEDLHIKKSLSEKKIEAISQQLEQLKQKKQMERQNYHRMFNLGLVVLILMGFLLILIEMNKYKLKEKYRQIRQLQFSRAVDQQHFLLAGLRNLAKSTDDLYQKKLAYAGSPVWEQQLALREKFNLQIAKHIRPALEKLHNGRKIATQLTLEDLSIIYLSQQPYHPDDYIGWMLGYQVDNAEERIIRRKEQIRRMMADAGMKKSDIRFFTIAPIWCESPDE